MNHYVQHISGQGLKWKVTSDVRHEWGVEGIADADLTHFLPKSEYRSCPPPPEQWVDVTARCEVADATDALGPGSIILVALNGAVRVNIFHPYQRQNFRLVKTKGGFRVEERRP